MNGIQAITLAGKQNGSLDRFGNGTATGDILFLQLIEDFMSNAVRFADETFETTHVEQNAVIEHFDQIRKLASDCLETGFVSFDIG